ncbi:hypothetical protein COW46_02015 [Candidatus Gracilibacteria bacterium CG17_big_fil_post_rev_8_21_14_2_50_48_13]|nr:MAG: hypothetical protein COW46_02015 [Candidatus Gracilibacteria bacterium CG17_big_fil_post_rev_8_21_14_2_50_48_13]
MSFNRSRTLLAQGFTLVEVLIVILIIALLMAFIIPQVLKGPAQARDLVRMNDVGNIAVALDSYRSAKQGYPKVSATGCLEATTGLGQELVKAGMLNADKFPKDPEANNLTGNCPGKYAYKMVNVNGVSNGAVIIYSKLETPARATATDSDINQGSLTSEYVFGKPESDRKYYHQVAGL